MASVTLEVGKTYLSREGKSVTIIEEEEFGFYRFKFKGNNKLSYTKYGISTHGTGSKHQLVITKEEADLLKDNDRQLTPTQTVVKVDSNITYMTVNLDKRDIPFKLDINQNGKITRIELFSDFDAPVVQS